MTDLVYWKNDLPEEWKLLPLKAVASYAVSSVDKVVKEEEIPVLLCNYTDVYKNDFITGEIEFMHGSATEAEIDNFKLEVGDVIITKDSESWDDIAIPALVKETKENLVCGYHLAVIKTDKEKLNPEFLFRCLQSKEIRLQMELASTGVTRYGLPKDAIGRTMLPVPKIEKQNTIVKFIEESISEIDKLIIEKEKLIKLLEEQRQALITQSITKGINPNVKLKDSGIDWLGEIPEHWNVERTKWLFKERNQRSETGEEELLTVSHITGVTSRAEKDVNMFEAETTEGYKIVHKGDLVINTLWAWMGAMGTSPLDGIASPAYHVYEPLERILPEYVDAIVRMPVFASEVIRFSKGVWSSRLRLYPEGFYEVYFPVPSTSEQKEIIHFLEKQINKNEKIVASTKRSLDLLNEKRESLITSIITGKTDFI